MPLPADLAVDVKVDSEVPLSSAVTDAVLQSLAEHVLRTEGVSGDWQFGVRFIDDETMRQAHIDFMGINSPTDIMTFPYEDDGFEHGAVGGAVLAENGGDLLISVDRVADHAKDAGWKTDQELFFVVTHGILHMLGWDDATDAERKQMLERQHQLLAAWRA